MDWNAVGYLASGLVLATFGTKDMSSLRSLAILSNVAFITYGAALGLTPIWLLHCLLLPLNLWRLFQVLQEDLSAAGKTWPGRWLPRIIPA
jgi:hypothetical protein